MDDKIIDGEAVIKDSSRDVSIDMAKGIAILLMIYYHLSSDFRPIIYSFHIPLFFIFSGYFAKDVKNYGEFLAYTKRNAGRLLLPYLVTSVLLVVNGLVKWFKSGLPDALVESIQRLLWSGGDIKYTQYGMIALGPLWFLIALFWTREFFALLKFLSCKMRCSDQISCWLLVGACIFISVAAVVAHPSVGPVPLCIFQGCVALAFYAVGYGAGRKMFPKWTYFIALICWPASILWGG